MSSEIATNSSYEIVKSSNKKNKQDINNFFKKTKSAGSGIPKNLDKKLERSLCICLYKEKQLMAFGFVTTDYGEVACITDCYVSEEVSPKEKREQQELIIKAFCSHSQLATIEKHKWFAMTSDAQSIFKSFGFIDTFSPGVMMLTKREKKFPLSAQEKKAGIDIKIEVNNFRDFAAALNLLQKESWAHKYSENYLARLVKYSRCYGVYQGNRLIAFARVVTDYDTFASLWDMVVDKAFRGRGYASVLLKKIFEDEAIKDIETWLFLTRNPLIYMLGKKFGFKNKGPDHVLRLPHASDSLFRRLPQNQSEKISENFYFYKGIFDRNTYKIGAVVIASIILYAFKDHPNFLRIMMALGVIAVIGKALVSFCGSFCQEKNVIQSRERLCNNAWAGQQISIKKNI